MKKIMGTELEAYHSPPPSVDVKNAISYTSTFPSKFTLLL